MYTVSLKNRQNCFRQNFVKFPLTLIIFGKKMAKTMKLCEVHSFSTSPNLCQRTEVRATWNSLQNIVTAADSLASFKSRLKTHLFNQTFRPACS